MKYLQLCTIFLVLGCLIVNIKSSPIENVIIASTLPVFLPDDVPSVTETPKETVEVAAPLSLLDVETVSPSSTDASEESKRTARGLGFGGLGGLGGLGGKFGGLGLGLKSFGGFGGWGLGGLHGLGGGFGGFKPFFGKHLG